MNIHGFLTLTLLDFPGHLAATVFLGSCNLRCPFCQNGNLVLAPEQEPCIPEEEVLAHLKKRRSVLDGVCVSGGEPTLCAELPAFLERIKEMGYLVKLDTNGSDPDQIRSLHRARLIDFVAMDIKNSRRHYALTAGIDPESGRACELLENVSASVEYLKTSGIDYEFRTTVTRELHTYADFADIGQWLAGSRRYFLQAYRDSEHILASYAAHPVRFHSPARATLEQYRALLQKTIAEVEIRGADPA